MMRPRLAFFSALLLMCVPLAVPAPAQPPAPPAKNLALDAIPTDSFAFLTVNAGKLWDNPDFKPLRDWFAAQKVGPTDELVGLPGADLDRVTVFLPAAENAAVLLVTTRKPYNEARVLKALNADLDADAKRVGNVVRTDNPKFPVLVLVDDRTLMFLPGSREEPALAGLVGQLLTKKADGPLATALADAGKHDVACGLDVRPLVEKFDLDAQRAVHPYLVLGKAKTLTLAIDFDKTARGSLKLSFADEATAKRAAPVLKEGIAVLAASIAGPLAERKDRVDPSERIVLESVVAVLKAAKIETEGANVFALADVPYADAVTKLATALPKSWTAAVNSKRGQNNLKQLALAMHNFESSFAVFPSDVTPGPAGKPWSWRVQILPFLEQDNLYRQLDVTKAWDDPANLKKLEAMEMPKVFEIPGRPAPKGHTYFRVFSLPKNAKGKERAWLIEGQQGPRITDITDGTSNTFMIVEAGEAVPWYKPDVLAYDGVLPLPQLGDKNADSFLVAFGDGSVRVLKRSKLNEKTLRALITPNGGEVVNLP
jgi:hypothetical protein